MENQWRNSLIPKQNKILCAQKAWVFEKAKQIYEAQFSNVLWVNEFDVSMA